MPVMASELLFGEEINTDVMRYFSGNCQGGSFLFFPYKVVNEKGNGGTHPGGRVCKADA